MAKVEVLTSFKKKEKEFRKAMIATFGLIFIGVVSYWVYETNRVYNELSFKTLEQLTRDEVKKVAAFQGSILAFLVCAFFHFSEKLS